MKVTTERLPNSLIALNVELEPERIEKGLDRAARRISEKTMIPGFRKGKAPRFIVENYFGRATLMEEATEDLINRAFREALEQVDITPVGQPQIESVDPNDGFRFRITVPVSPTVTLPDYRALRIPLEAEPVTDDLFEHTMNNLRNRHVVLRELDDPRPAQQGDQLTVQLETIVDGERLEAYPDNEEIPENTMILEPDQIIDDLYNGLLGVQVDETREITTHMPADHPDAKVCDKDVTFKVRVVGIQERLLPDWEELPTLEEFDGTLDDLRAKTRADLEQRTQQAAEQKLIDSFIEQVVAQTEFDLPQVMITEVAEELLNEQGGQFARYGITLDQMLQFRNQTRAEAIEELLPEAERRLKVRLALREIVEQELLDVSPSELHEAATEMLSSYGDEERDAVMQALARKDVSTQFFSNVAHSVLNRKLRARLMAIAAGEAPEPGSDHDHDHAHDHDHPDGEAAPQANDAPHATPTSPDEQGIADENQGILNTDDRDQTT